MQSLKPTQNVEYLYHDNFIELKANKGLGKKPSLSKPQGTGKCVIVSSYSYGKKDLCLEVIDFEQIKNDFAELSPPFFGTRMTNISIGLVVAQQFFPCKIFCLQQIEV